MADNKDKEKKEIKEPKETKAKAEPKAKAKPKVKAKAAETVKAKPEKKAGAKAAPKAEAERGHRKIRAGRVVSNKMDKTVVVTVETQFRHPFYKKIIKQTKKFVAHDEENQTNIGDLVEIMETRPLSKLKRWRLLRIVEKTK